MLYIVTPLSRIDLLNRVRDSIFANMPIGDEWVWFIIVDKAHKDAFLEADKEFQYSQSPNVTVRYSPYRNALAGHGHRNVFLDYYDINLRSWANNDWVYFLDDDTVLHTDFYKILQPELICATTAAITFRQNFPNGNLRLTGADVEVGKIDMGQYIVNLAKVPSHFRFQENNYCADGQFIQDFYEIHGHTFRHIPQVLSVYNALRPLTK